MIKLPGSFGQRGRLPPGCWNFGKFTWLLAALLWAGCAGRAPLPSTRTFVFGQDSVAFANETSWNYQIDPVSGRTIHTRRKPAPSYVLHCFVVARSARQFFQNARFDPNLPPVDDATYEKLIRRVVSIDPQRPPGSHEKIVIPGYESLYALTEARGALFKKACGGAWQSYFQRGNWRMILPFTRHQQERMAQKLFASLEQNIPPVVHVVRFPQLSINHAILLFDSQETKEGLLFQGYDPNIPNAPIKLLFNRARRRFIFPPTHYFAGGPVDVYRIYSGWIF
jgi:hypothetical protein